jgi:hypothetical protein
MPRDIVQITIMRNAQARTATGGHVPTLVPIPGSPVGGWNCRLYRRPEITVHRDEAAPGVATVDPVRILSIIDTTAPVLINDIAKLPEGIDAKIIRIRRYTRTLQCDLETGVE